ncbi:glycosyltransferase family 2 protein [Desulfonatronum lacustre]|uniref:glycosyltransferase family 2 protein n=1 Tax=Desulfonatronum lacustre TaxID=66849 RepID=UPI0004ACAF44|nr:glycosyltransferase family 2 protein [Desulfonatronum lacustre]
MNEDFQYVSPGIVPELNALTLDEVCQHLATHLNSFILDDSLGAAYFNRFVHDETLASNTRALNCFFYILRKMGQIDPFNPTIINMTQQTAPSPEKKIKLKLLMNTTLTQEKIAQVQKFLQGEKSVNGRGELVRCLRHNCSDVALANYLLDFDLSSGHNPQEWMKTFHPPDIFKKEWECRKIYLYARSGNTIKALKHWERVADNENEVPETILNYAAACLIRNNAKDAAASLLKQSLRLDASQPPVNYLSEELQSPFCVDKHVVQTKDIIIGVYTHNKADLLQQTLQSLRQSCLGKARCFLLLNGCSDESFSVARAAKEDFPDGQLSVFQMPINIGAPAARNFLVHEALKTECDYMAFLDDDVVIPENWLQSLATAIQEEPGIGAVGCKIMNPQPASTMQYLFRDVSIVKKGIFRLSLATPFWTIDPGFYGIRRDVDSVMGCCHLIKRECLEQVPEFDIQFSPSQLDDVAFHLDLRLKGYRVRYLGQLECTHYRSTGFQSPKTSNHGSSLGNDVKFYYRFKGMFQRMRDWQRKRNEGIIPTLDSLC